MMNVLDDINGQWISFELEIKGKVVVVVVDVDFGFGLDSERAISSSYLH